jgi:hypothetical protein
MMLPTELLYLVGVLGYHSHYYHVALCMEKLCTFLPVVHHCSMFVN